MQFVVLNPSCTQPNHAAELNVVFLCREEARQSGSGMHSGSAELTASAVSFPPLCFQISLPTFTQLIVVLLLAKTGCKLAAVRAEIFRQCRADQIRDTDSTVTSY